LKKRSKKLLSVLASAFPDGLSPDNQKFFGSFFQKRTAFFLQPIALGRRGEELAIEFGSGYCVWRMNDGADIIILLGGSTKARQHMAICKAQAACIVYDANCR